MKTPLFLIMVVTAVVATSALSAASVPATVQVAPEVAQKISRGSALSIAEIAALSRAGFPEDRLRAHLRYSRAVYRLSTSDIAELQSAGASNALIDDMLARTYEPTAVRRYAYPGPRFYRSPFPSYGGARFGSHGFRGGFHGGGRGRH